MSKTAAIYPIVSALAKADDILGLKAVWNSSSEVQRRFLTNFFILCRDEVIPEIESIASRSAEEINRFLSERGFSIQLDQFTDPRDFGTASVLDVLVEWAYAGEKVPIVTDLPNGKRYDGVALKRATFWAARGIRDGVIARLETKTDDVVNMMMYDYAPEGMDMVHFVENLRVDRGPLYRYSGLHFPMVNLDQMVDISWVKGLIAVGRDGVPAIITQALQQTKLRINEKGARAQSTAALGVIRCSIGPAPDPKPPLIINKPFLFWIERPSLSYPLFVAHITEDDWKNPGNISTK